MKKFLSVVLLFAFCLISYVASASPPLPHQGNSITMVCQNHTDVLITVEPVFVNHLNFVKVEIGITENFCSIETDYGNLIRKHKFYPNYNSIKNFLSIRYWAITKKTPELYKQINKLGYGSGALSNTCSLNINYV